MIPNEDADHTYGYFADFMLVALPILIYELPHVQIILMFAGSSSNYTLRAFKSTITDEQDGPKTGIDTSSPTGFATYHATTSARDLAKDSRSASPNPDPPLPHFAQAESMVDSTD